MLGAGGIAVLWWQADQAQRDRWQDPSGRINPLRAVVGGGGWAGVPPDRRRAADLVSAIMLFSLRSGSVEVALNVGLAAALGILGLGLMVGPWLLRLSSDLSEEREARVRSEERADVAAHLHDSVLQTLALIQRSAGDAPRSSRLARAQERDLRSWLFATRGDGPRPSPRRCARSPPRSRTPTACRSRWSASATGRSPRPSGPLVLATREAIANAAGTPARRCRRLRRGGRPRRRGVRPGPWRAASTSRVPTDRSGSAGASSGRMERGGGTW